jgi:uncharacterized damage-inducible protein DinB
MLDYAVVIKTLTNSEVPMTVETVSSALVIPSAALLDHWQGHRRLTRRVIESFPEDQFPTFSIGSMRPFAAISKELMMMAEPTVRGIVTGNWEDWSGRDLSSKKELLRQWDQSTEQINDLWPQIPPERFQEMITAFGKWPGRVHDLLLYIIDNEIHHRGQGYVYLRALGIEPPPFYERK